MAAVLVQTKTLTYLGIEATQTVTMDSAFTPGNKVIVSFSAYTNGGGDVTSVVVGGSVAAARRANNTQRANDRFCFYDTGALPVGLSTQAVVITPPAGSGTFALTVVVSEWKGVGDFDPRTMQDTATGTSTSPSATTPSALDQPRELVMALWSHGNGNNVSITGPGGAWASILNVPNGLIAETADCSYTSVASQAAVAGTATLGSSLQWFAIIATWKLTGTDAPFPIQQRAPGFPPAAPLPGIVALDSGILKAPFVASAIAGTADAAASAFAATVAGLVTFTATGSAATAPFAADATGAQTASAAGAPMALPGPRFRGYPSRLVAPPEPVLGSGILADTPTPGYSGSGAAACSPFAVTATGLVTFTATGAAALSSFAAATSGAETFDCSGSATTSPFAASGSGAETFAATGSAAISPFGASGAVAETFSAAGSAAASPFAATSTGVETFDGSGSAAVSSFAITSLGVFAIPAPFAQAPPRVSGFPSRVAFPAQKLGVGLLSTAAAGALDAANVAVSPFAVGASGLLTFTGSGSAAVSPFAASAAGLESFTGTGSAAESPFATTSSGAETYSGSAGAACSSFAASASGTETFTGTGSAACSPFAATGSGTSGDVNIGSGSAAMSPFAATSSGTEAFTGTASAAESSFTASGSATESFLGSSSAAASPFAATGSAFTGSFVGVGAVAASPFGVDATGIFGAPYTFVTVTTFTPNVTPTSRRTS